MTARQPTATLIPVAVFAGAFLLFQVQPIIGRYVLPWFGGAPAVWSTCLLFFQLGLLAGYLYAHWLGSLRSPRKQAAIHITLLTLSLALLPIAPNATRWKPAGSDAPSWHILLLLAATAGAPYFLLSTTGPLLQRWFTLDHPQRSPWRLYALSNLGSFLALLTYPVLVEPLLRLRAQSLLWSAGYIVFVLLCAASAWSIRRAAPAIAVSAPAEQGPPPTPLLLLLWTALAATGSALLAATTNLLTEDVSVSPYLWVAPLSVYLLTFVIAFESERWYVRRYFAVAAGLMTIAACAVLGAGPGLSLPFRLAVYLLVLFVSCMVCHGELRHLRPSPRYLTTFYLTLALGGVLGSVFVALLAPVLFTAFSEYPIALSAACLLGAAAWLRSREDVAVRVPLAALVIGGLASAVTVGGGSNEAGVLARERNFYGTLRLTEGRDANGTVRQLTHGSIKHGSQYVKQPLRSQPTSYFGPHSGAGIVLRALEAQPRRIAIVGLGAGTLAAWGRSGDRIRFYEINPAVDSIARQWFSYLAESKANVEIVIGDARVQLERELAAGREHDFDILIVDAFSSDAIPVHLLTAECADLYRRRLATNGILLLHISNRSLNLEPVVRGLARHLDWSAAQFLSRTNRTTGEDGSSWVLISANAQFLIRVTTGANVGWRYPDRAPLLWTDDFSSMWHVLRF